ncbi:hypothetical protein MASR1M42_15170 [Azonexus hydrophilus]
MLSDLNLYQQADDLAEAYIDYTHPACQTTGCFLPIYRQELDALGVETSGGVGQAKRSGTPIGQPKTATTSINLVPPAVLEQLPDSHVLHRQRHTSAGVQRWQPRKLQQKLPGQAYRGRWKVSAGIRS